MPTVAELQIDVDADISGAEAKLAAVQGLIEALDGQDSDVRLDADVAVAEAQLRDLAAQLAALDSAAADVSVGADTSEAEAKVEKLDQKVKQVSGKKAVVRTEADVALTEARLQLLQGLVAELDKTTADIDVKAKTGAATADLVAIRDFVLTLSGMTAQVNVGEDGVDPTIAKLLALAGVVKRLDDAREVVVETKADTTLSQAKLLSLQQTVADLDKSTADIKTMASTGAATADLLQLRALVDDLTSKTARVKVDEDGAAATIAELITLAAVIKRIDGQKVRVHAEPEGFEDVRRELKRLGQAMVETSRGMDRTVRLIAGTAALISPALEVATAGVVALAGSIAAAGVGSVLFGAVAVSAFHPIADALAQMKTAQDAYNRATTDKQRDAALARLKQIYDDLEPAQQKMVDSIRDFQRAWGKFVTQFQPQIFDMASRGLQRFGDLLPQLSPIVQSIADAVDDLGRRMSRTLDTPRWQGFFDMLARLGGPSLNAIATAVGNVIEGFLGLVSAFEPLIVDFNGGLVSMTARFKEWANGLKDDQGFQTWVGRVRAMTPIVLAAIGSIWRAFVSLIESLSALGVVALPIITKVLNGLAKFQQAHPQIAALAVAFGALLFAMIQMANGVGLVAAGAKLLGGVFTAITGALGISAGAIIGVVVALAALAAAFIIAYRNSDTFRTAVNNLAAAVVDFAQRAGTAIMSGLGQAMAWLQSTFGPAVSAVIRFVLDEFNKMAAWAENNAGVLGDAWSTIVQTIQTYMDLLVSVIQTDLGVISALWSGMWPGLLTALQGVWTAIKGVVSGALQIIRGYITVFAGLITGDWQSVWDGLKMIAQGWSDALGGIVEGAFQIIEGLFAAKLGALLTAWDAFWSILPDGVQKAFSLIDVIVSTALQSLIGVLTGNTSMIQEAWSVLWNSLPAIVRVGLQTVAAIIEAAVHAFVAPFQWLYNVLVGHSIIPDLIAAIVAAFASLTGLVLAALAGFVAAVVAVFVQVVVAVTAAMVQVALAVTNGMVAVALAFTLGFVTVVAAVTAAFVLVVVAVAQGMVLMAAAVTAGMVALALAFTTGFLAVAVAVALGMVGVALAVTTGFVAVNLAVTLGMLAFALAVTAGFAAVNLAVLTGMVTMAAAVTTGFVTVNLAVLMGMALFAATVTAGFALVVAAVVAGMAAVAAAVTVGMAAVVAAAVAGWAAEVAVTAAGMAATVAIVVAGMAAVVAVTVAGMAAANAATAAGVARSVATHTSGMARTTAVVRAGMAAVGAAVRAGMAAFVAAVQSGGARAVAAVRSAVNSMVAVARAAAGSMASAGRSLMSAFAAGVRATAGQAVAAARSAVAKIAAILPGSPAEEGPLSGQGYTKIRGQHFSQDLAAGIAMEEDAIRRATENLAGMMAFPTPAVTGPRTAVANPTVRAPRDDGRQVAVLERIATILEENGSGDLHLTVTTDDEPKSVKVNKKLQRVAGLGLVD